MASTLLCGGCKFYHSVRVFQCALPSLLIAECSQNCAICKYWQKVWVIQCNHLGALTTEVNARTRVCGLYGPHLRKRGRRERQRNKRKSGGPSS